MTPQEVGVPACPDHQGDAWPPPWLACRFAYLCDACLRLMEDAVLGDLRPVFDAHRKRSRLATDWEALHSRWDELGTQGEDPRAERLRTVGRIGAVDEELARALAVLSEQWVSRRPYAVEDVLYVLDPPLGWTGAHSVWKLAGRLVAMRTAAGDIKAGRDPGEDGFPLPVSPWPGRFFMIQDEPDPDREGRTVARYVEVTRYVGVHTRSAGKVE